MHRDAGARLRMPPPVTWMTFLLVCTGTPPRLVAVPTHFFKVVLAERGPAAGSEGEQDAVLGAFVLPNAPVQPDTPLTAFSVPVESLEEAAGGATLHCSDSWESQKVPPGALSRLAWGCCCDGLAEQSCTDATSCQPRIPAGACRLGVLPRLPQCWQEGSHGQSCLGVLTPGQVIPGEPSLVQGHGICKLILCILCLLEAPSKWHIASVEYMTSSQAAGEDEGIESTSCRTPLGEAAASTPPAARCREPGGCKQQCSCRCCHRC